ncbi:hypothetical protein [Gaiella sp.]|jgi:hypothetical protein|uniref:hypothetical protein n=1 Tax=Gaiella sp. TaxID=2663207 RepID=UPI002E3099C3|nr:hypothetical protein [Gaiella sp.]HEX5583075.1 hypothetical protein [Gaiella sp.]
MGLDDIKDDLMGRAQDIKSRLVQEFDEVNDSDMDEAGDDPDRIIDKVSEKTGKPREEVEQRVREVASH